MLIIIIKVKSSAPLSARVPGLSREGKKITLRLLLSLLILGEVKSPSIASVWSLAERVGVRLGLLSGLLERLLSGLLEGLLSRLLEGLLCLCSTACSKGVGWLLRLLGLLVCHALVGKLGCVLRGLRSERRRLLLSEGIGWGRLLLLSHRRGLDLTQSCHFLLFFEILSLHNERVRCYLSRLIRLLAKRVNGGGLNSSLS